VPSLGGVVDEPPTVVRQFIKYFGVALIGYVFDFGILIVTKEVFNMHYLVAATGGFLGGLIVVYLLSNRYVFGKSRIQSKSIEFGIFALIGIIGLILLNLLMWALTDGLGVNYILSKIAATVVVYIWNFFARRRMYHQ
jgi:putative flippase GtrA